MAYSEYERTEGLDRIGQFENPIQPSPNRLGSPPVGRVRMDSPGPGASHNRYEIIRRRWTDISKVVIKCFPKGLQIKK